MSEQWERGEHPAQAEVHEPVEPEDRPQVTPRPRRRRVSRTYGIERARLMRRLLASIVSDLQSRDLDRATGTATALFEQARSLERDLIVLRDRAKSAG